MTTDAASTQYYHFRALDGMRGFAALMVVGFHYSLELFEPTGWFQQNFILTTSYAFVDLFFILSGFVITHNYQYRIKRFSGLRVFFIKRIARLYPLLFATVLVYLVMKSYGIFAGFQFNDENYGWSLLLWETIDPLLFLNSTPLILNTEGLNPVSWSISAEMIAYTCFALVIYLSKRKSISVFSLILLLCLGFLIYQKKYLFTGDFGFIRGILNFTAGFFVYQIRGDHKNSSGRYLEWLLFPLIIGCFYLIKQSSTELMNLVLVPVFAFSVYILSFEKGYISSWLKSDMMQFFGKISYSVYLWHFIILWVFYVLSWQLFQLKPSKEYAIIGMLLVLTTTCIVATFSYKQIELKGSAFVKKKFNYS